MHKPIAITKPAEHLMTFGVAVLCIALTLAIGDCITGCR